MNKLALNFLLFSLAGIMLSCGGSSESSSVGDNIVGHVPSSNNSNSGENDSSSPSPSPSPSPPAPSLLSLALSSAESTLATPESTVLTAMGYYSDGQIVDLSATVNWSSSDDAIISLSSATATAQSSGVAIITADLAGVSSSLSLTAFSATLVGVELDESSLTLTSDGTFQFSATALYDNGLSQDVTTLATWSSSDAGIVDVDNVANKGLVTAVSAGSATITVDYSGQTDTAALSVSSAAITSLSVTPVIGSAPAGQSQNFTATAIADDGTFQDMSSLATWSSSDTSVLTIDSDGVASLLAPGIVTVTADYATFSKSVNYTVTSKTLSSLSVSFDVTSLAVGITAQASCIATYDDASTEDVTSSVIWSVDDPSLASISNTSGKKGEILALNNGSVIVTATLGTHAQSESLAISSATLSSISISPSSIMLAASIDQYFTATGTFSDGSTADITELVSWSSSNTAVATMTNSGSNRGRMSNLYSGGATQSLTVSADLSGVSGNSSVIITPGSITSLAVTPTLISMNTGKTQQLRAYAYFDDGASVEITSLALWNSDDESVVFVSNAKESAGEISSLVEGAANIEVSYKTLSSNQANITVSDSASESVNEVGSGLLASYFSGNNFNTLMGQRVDATLDFNWSTGNAPMGVGNNFSVRWQGEIMGKEDGNCTIASRSDDGFRISLDGGSTYLIDVWFPHAPRWDYAYNVPFSEGVKQTILVEFFENGGHAVAELYWQCPSDGALEVIPSAYLFSE